jgi:hypothetical protein
MQVGFKMNVLKLIIVLRYANHYCVLRCLNEMLNVKHHQAENVFGNFIFINFLPTVRLNSGTYSAYQ